MARVKTISKAAAEKKRQAEVKKGRPAKIAGNILVYFNKKGERIEEEIA